MKGVLISRRCGLQQVSPPTPSQGLDQRHTRAHQARPDVSIRQPCRELDVLSFDDIEVPKHICPVARTLAQIGDAWTLLIIRDALNGKTRFSEFQSSLGVAKNILSSRLRMLVSNGMLVKRPSPDGQGRAQYFLTERGRRLRLVLTALRQFGEENLFAHGEAMMIAHDRDHKAIARLQLMNEDGRILEPEEILVSRGRKGGRARAGSRTRPARVE